jgi:hypothetical protein
MVDGCFGEEGCQEQKERAVETLTMLRNMALYRLRTTAIPEKRFSTRMNMLRATISDEFLHAVLFGRST